MFYLENKTKMVVNANMKFFIFCQWLLFIIMLGNYRPIIRFNTCQDQLEGSLQCQP